MVNDGDESDSHALRMGLIPGSEKLPAFEQYAPLMSRIPVMIAVPHAGRSYPLALLQAMRAPDSAPLRLEDRYVDKLAQAVSLATGASLQVALAPRAMIDLNRAPDDVDWEMLAREGRSKSALSLPSRRVRGGLGLIPRRLPGMGEIWLHPLRREDLDARLEQVHVPYHAALAQALQVMRERWGIAVLIDLHSMPPLPVPQGGGVGAQLVIGDRFGVACHGSLVATAFSCLAEMGVPAAHNRPYAGGYVLERHADPRAGIYALQIEIDRSAYLDADFAEPGEGMPAMVNGLTRLVHRLAGAAQDLTKVKPVWLDAAE